MPSPPWPTNLPPLEPFPTDVNQTQAASIQRFTQNWLTLTGEQLALAQSDPRYLFNLSYAMMVVLLCQQGNLVFNQNFLPFMTGAFLDWWGLNFGCFRDAAAYAEVELKFTLGVTSSTPTVVPSGTQVGSSGATGLIFATNEDLVIPANTLSGSVGATCTVTGTVGNDLAPNTITTLLNWSQPFVTGVTNISSSDGGADPESNEAFSFRLFLATDSFSVAGPPAAYLYFIYRSSSAILQAVVWSPSPCVVNIQFINQDLSIPNDAQMSALLAYLQAGDPNEDDIVPTTDQVFCIAPYTLSYSITAYYKVKASNQGNLSSILGAVQAAFINWITWQQSAIGRNVDISYLADQLVNAQASDVSIPTLPWILSGVPKGQTQVALAFTTPASGASQTIQVLDSSWMSPLIDSGNRAYGFLLIPGAGLFAVTAIPDGTHVTITNLTTGIVLDPAPVAGIAVALNAYIVSPPILGQETLGQTLEYQGVDYGK